MKYPKLRELKEAIIALFSKPYTSQFPKGGHKPYSSFRGQPRYNDQKCVGCLACEQVCPVGAIGHKDVTEGGSPHRILYHYTDTCIFCGQCETACIADHLGIKLSNDWELSFFDRAKAYESITKDLELCEICGSVIACKDHLRWVSDKLGELTYSSPTLYLSRLKNLGIIDNNIIEAMKDGARSDRVKVLCASCRRSTTNTTK